MADAPNITDQSDGIVNVTTASRGIILEPTMRLRWSGGVLQQAWIDKVSGEIDWRDVPEE